MEHLKEFCTPRQLEIVEAVIKYPNKQLAANALGVSRSTVRNAIRGAEKKAAANGVAPNRDVNHRTMEGFNAKFVTSRYDGDGNLQGQYVRQEREKFDLEAMLEAFRDGFKDELKGLHKPVTAPVNTVDKLMNCYMIGDHHLGMYAWSKQTGEDSYDTDIAVNILESAVDSLVARSPDSRHGLLVNLGDFFHSNNIKSETAAGTRLDSDGRYGRTVRMGVNLVKRLIVRLLQKHEVVTVLNVRGNHDPDAALWLNEALRMYFADEPRVTIPNNYNVSTHFVFGNSLIVTHHGNGITPQRIYEQVTRTLAVEWGKSKYRFGWLGHLHHKESKEIGGMIFEQWNVLAPPDAWHSSSGFGSSRSMTCVVLSEEYGEDSRVTVNPDRINGEKND